MATKPKPDIERALALNYPTRPNVRGRAVIKWKQVSCDMGPYGSAESFFTLLALRSHFAEGGDPPDMKDLRKSVVAEADPIAADDLKVLTSDLAAVSQDRDQLRTQVEALESTIALAEEGLSDTITRRDELAAANAELKSQLGSTRESLDSLLRKRPWKSWTLACVATAACFVTVCFLAAAQPKVGGEPLTISEKAIISNLRSGVVEISPTDLPPEIDGVVLSDVEVRSIRLFRHHQKSALEKDSMEEQSERVLERMRKRMRDTIQNSIEVGAKEWPQEEHLAGPPPPSPASSVSD
ncbi:MAG: hypothetical protein AAFX06_19315 [Planctomycetota bacterium]